MSIAGPSYKHLIRQRLPVQVARRARTYATGPTLEAKPTRTRTMPRYAPLSLLALFPALYLLFPQAEPELSPQVYSKHKLASSERLSNQHVLLRIPIPAGARGMFESPEGSVALQHVMIKSPDLQIERPYTFVNDAAQDGELRLVVKRVKGGEVGRHIHTLKEGEIIEIRGPVPTYNLNPSAYDRIVMISTGTAISPFLQLLSKIPTDTATPRLHLLHSLPARDRPDWVANTELLPGVQRRLGDRLTVERVSFDALLDKDVLERAVGGREKVLVLVCLPPVKRDALCGPLTCMLEQGALGGILKEMGLTSSQVWKFE